MKKKIKILIGVLVAAAVIVITALICFNHYNKTAFFTENDTKINTDRVISYTVLDDNNNSVEYKADDEKFKTIDDILTNAEPYHNKNDIRPVSKDSGERLMLKGKYNAKAVFIVYYAEKPDGSYELILKDYCEGKGTTYLLDFHDYLEIDLTPEEYSAIFE